MDDATVARLRHFRDSIVVPLSQTDAEKWPMRSGRVVKLIASDLAGEFFADIATLRKRGMTTRDIALLFGNPSRLWRIAHHLVNGLRASGASVEEQRQGVLALVDLAEELKAGTAFCEREDGVVYETGANLVLGDTEAKTLWESANEREAAVSALCAHRVAASLWSCAESLYFVAHELGVEMHGPYPLPDGSVMVVRDFFRLNPIELWPRLAPSSLDFGLLRIATAYSPFHGSFDVYNNLYLEPGYTMLPNTTVSAVWLDGECKEEAELERLCQDASAAITSVVSLVEAWSDVDIARKYVEVLWWRKRELAEAARGQWSPTSVVVEKITAEALPPASSRNPSVSALREEFDLTSS